MFYNKFEINYNLFKIVKHDNVSPKIMDCDF